MSNPYAEMQRAVDVVGTSAHPTNKIAATVFGRDLTGGMYSIARTNYWPPAIARTIGTEDDIGDSSGTVHAETVAILASPYTMGASLCVTDPFCPNCAKNIAEAGIKTIYIDHKGFDKDFAARRSGDFESMSMRVCEKAGINVYEIRRKEEKLIPILEIPHAYQPQQDRPVQAEQIMQADAHQLKLIIDAADRAYPGYRLACALGQRTDGKYFALTALAHPAIGYTLDHDMAALEKTDGKYSFIMEPVNRILMNAKRYGMTLIDGLLYSAQVPTSREQVNMAGAGITSLYIGDTQKARDNNALQAMLQMTTAGIMQYKPVRMLAE